MADREVFGVGRDDAVLEDNSSGLFLLGSALGCDNAFLIFQWLPHEDLTIL